MTGAVAAASTGEPFYVGLSSLFVSGYGSTALISTDPVSVVILQGGSFTYAWEYVSGAMMSIFSPDLSTTYFRGSPAAPGDTDTAYFRCAVTLAGVTIYSPTVRVDVTRT